MQKAITIEIIQQTFFFFLQLFHMITVFSEAALFRFIVFAWTHLSFKSKYGSKSKIANFYGKLLASLYFSCVTMTKCVEAEMPMI